MAAARPIGAPPPRCKVLTTAMDDDAPPAKKRIVKKGVVKTAVVKKRPVGKPAAKKIAPATTPVAVAAVPVEPDVEPELHSDATSSASIWHEPRDPRPPRRSAVERLDDPPPADGALLVARVANAIERELTQIEIIVGNNRVPPRERSEAERRARTLASLARTLSLVTQLREKNMPRPDDDDDDAVPRDLDDLREALARRLERLVADRTQSADREPDAG